MAMGCGHSFLISLNSNKARNGLFQEAPIHGRYTSRCVSQATANSKSIRHQPAKPLVTTTLSTTFTSAPHILPSAARARLSEGEVTSAGQTPGTPFQQAMEGRSKVGNKMSGKNLGRFFHVRPLRARGGHSHAHAHARSICVSIGLSAYLSMCMGLCPMQGFPEYSGSFS